VCGEEAGGVEGIQQANCKGWFLFGNPARKSQRLPFCFHLESSNQNIDDFIMLVSCSISGPLFAAASPGILQRGGIAKSRE